MATLVPAPGIAPMLVRCECHDSVSASVFELLEQLLHIRFEEPCF
jgi:hypothetical protein